MEAWMTRSISTWMLDAHKIVEEELHMCPNYLQDQEILQVLKNLAYVHGEKARSLAVIEKVFAVMFAGLRRENYSGETDLQYDKS